MSKVKRNCRVCGKLYTPCVDCDNDYTAFHWREVACSYECGKEYIKRVEEGRKPLQPIKELKNMYNKKSKKEQEEVYEFKE